MSITEAGQEAGPRKLERYAWRALGAQHPDTGQRKEETGVARAISADAVRQELAGRDLIPLEVILDSERGMRREVEFNFRKRPKPGVLAETMRQLAVMVDADIGINEAVDSVAEGATDPIMREALAIVYRDIENGMPLEDALSEHPYVFPSMIVRMIEASNQSGTLEVGLTEIADSLDASDELSGKIKSAMLYPLVLFFMTVVVGAFMMIYLMPMFDEMYGSMGAELPAYTQMMIGISQNFPLVFGITTVLGVAAVMWYRKNRETDKVRKVRDSILLKIPVFGRLNRESAMSRFARNLSSMMISGVDILVALDIVVGTVGNYHMEESIKRSRAALENGQNLVGPLKENPHLFPPFATRMIDVGYDTGRVPFMLKHIQRTYDRRVARLTDNLAKLIEPLMMVVIGGVIGSLLVAMYLPLMTMGSLVG